MKTLEVMRSCFFSNFYRKYLLPEVSILSIIFSLTPVPRSIFKFITFCYTFITVASEEETIRKAREAFLIQKGRTIYPDGLNIRKGTY